MYTKKKDLKDQEKLEQILQIKYFANLVWLLSLATGLPKEMQNN